MKKIAIGLLFIATVFTAQLNFTSAKSAADITLDQLVQKAEACFEVLPVGYYCCPSIWTCYIGGDFFVEGFFMTFF